MASQPFQPLYHASHALVVGIDRYLSLTSLNTAVHGAQAVARQLRDSFQFSVTELYDGDATRESILRWFGRLRPHPDDRVLFYFAGHGITRPIGQRTEGYLALAGSDGFWNSLAMEDIIDEAEALPAKHGLFLLDACFSGLALRGRGGEFDAERTAEYLLTRKARYAITAGGEEVVDDDLAGEYSLFTHYLLNGLADPALTASGILRAKSLGLYLEETVSAHRRSRALPNHGYLVGSADGDFVFSWERGPRLSIDLQHALRSDVGEVRWGAVAALITIAKDTPSELAPIAREQLSIMAREDPDRRVRKAAQSLFDEEETLRIAEEDRRKQAESDSQLEAARQQQEEAERAMREAEAHMAELRRRADENRKLSEASEMEREQALERALQARQITPIKDTAQDIAIKPPKQVTPEPAAEGGGGLRKLVTIGVPLLVVVGVAVFVLATGVLRPKEPAASPTVMVSDSFDNPEFDGAYDPSLYEDASEADVLHAIEQTDGVLRMTQSPSSDGSSILYVKYFADVAVTSPFYVSARIMLEPGSVGRAFMQISVADDRIGNVGFGRCYISDALFSNCGLYHAVESETTPVEIQMASWHTMRIEIAPSTLVYTFYIDGSNQGNRGISNPGRVSSPSYQVLFVLEGLEVTANFDDLEIGLLD